MQYVVEISATGNLEMVKWEALVEFSWNNPIL